MSNFSERRSHPLKQIAPISSPRGRKNSIHYSYNVNPDRPDLNFIKLVPEKRSVVCPSNLIIQIPGGVAERKILETFKRKDKKLYEPEEIIQQYLPLTPPCQPNKAIQTSIRNLKKSTASTFWKTNSDCQSDVAKLPTPQRFLEQESTKRTLFNNFQVVKQIGSGKFSKVSMVYYRDTGFVAALKIMPKKNITDQTVLTQLIREIKILSFVNHPNIVSLYGVFSDPSNIYLIQQMGCGGQLYSLLCKSKTFSEQAVSFIMKGLLEAVAYLHSHHILHRDIKPENVIIVHGMVKLCDLGWSIYTQSKFRETMCGTPLYSSPELILREKYNQKVDLWALGIMAYQLRFGFAPFDIKNRAELNKIVTDEITFPDAQISEQFEHFVKSLLQKNPKERLTAQMMKNHPFILKYKDFETCQQLCIQKDN